MKNDNQNDRISFHGAIYERKRIDKIMFDFENIAIVVTKAEGQFIHGTIVQKRPLSLQLAV